MILNDIWEMYIHALQSNSSTDIAGKMRALNLAQRYLVERMFFKGRIPPEFQITANMENTIDLNYVTLPSLFLSLHRAWYRSETSYLNFGQHSNITIDDLQDRIGQSFFDTSDTGTPSLIATKRPYLYFDKHFDNEYIADETITGKTSGATATVDSVSGTTLTYTLVGVTPFTDGEVIEGTDSGTLANVSANVDPTMTIAITGGTKDIKIKYNKLPTDIVAYGQLDVTIVSGNFTIGEWIVGTDSSAIAQLKAATYGALTSNLYLFSDGYEGVFAEGELVTGQTSGETATVSTALAEKVQELEWHETYRFLLIEAAVLLWQHLDGTNEAEARSDIVDNLIDQFEAIENNSATSAWGFT